MGGGRGHITTCDAKFWKKCLCLHNNNTDLIKRLYLLYTVLVMTNTINLKMAKTGQNRMDPQYWDREIKSYPKKYYTWMTTFSSFITNMNYKNLLSVDILRLGSTFLYAIYCMSRKSWPNLDYWIELFYPIYSRNLKLLCFVNE